MFRQENNKAWKAFIEADKIRQVSAPNPVGMLGNCLPRRCPRPRWWIWREFSPRRERLESE